MPTLYVYFKPTNAPKYNIRWRRSTDTLFPAEQNKQVLKVAGTWNSTEIIVADSLTDWVYEVTAICEGSMSSPVYGTVKATCAAVTLTAKYNHCTCPELTGIVLTTG
jgi:hypothetical protein